jgi:type I restriction enzyme, S subunit
MKYRRYPKYKDSGVEWLGETPEGWHVYPIRRKLVFRPDGIKIGPFGSQLKLEYIKYAGYKVYGQENVIAADFSRGNRYVDEAKFIELKACEVVPGDILVTMMGSSGRSMVVPKGIDPGLMDSHLIRIRLPDDDLDPRFVALVMDRASYIKEQLETSGKGAIMHGLNSEIVKSIYLAVPPRSEQESISAFLDRETARIDALVAKKERLIELLQEKRSALITRVITKGLDPNVLMKDSGIEWLGEIPIHWEVKRVKDVSRFVTSGSRGWAEYYSDAGSLFLRIGNLTTGSIDLDLSELQYVSLPTSAEGMRTRVQSGDILISITALIGAVAVIPDNFQEAYVNQHLALVRLSDLNASSRWVGYCALSMIGQEQMLANLYGGTKDGLGLDDIRSLVVVMPPIQEQKEITHFLDEECKRSGALIMKIREGLERLNEYRTALVSAAVTGKIDVREEVG